MRRKRKGVLALLFAIALVGSAWAQTIRTETQVYQTADQMLLANEINESGEPYAEAIGYNLDDLDPFHPNQPDNTGYVLGIENYEYSRYQLGVVIARSGIGLHMMWSPVIGQMAAMETDPGFDGRYTGGVANGYKEDDELVKTVMHFGMLAKHNPPMHPWPQFGEFVQADPHYAGTPDPQNWASDFATLRWDRSKMVKQLSPASMGQTLMKQYLWAQDMLGAFHDSLGNEIEADGNVSPDSANGHFDPTNGIFYGGDGLDGFVGQVLTAEAINKVKNIVMNLAYDGNALGGVDPASYNPSSGLRYFPHLVAVEESPIEGAALPPRPTGYSVVDASSHLFDQMSLLWGTLSFAGMMNPANSSDAKHLAYHSVFDGDPFPPDMSVSGQPGPFDLMKGVSKVILQNLMAMHLNGEAGTLVDRAWLDGGVVAQSDTVSTVNAGYALVVLNLAGRLFEGTPLAPAIQQALLGQATFLANRMHDTDGTYSDGLTLTGAVVGNAKTLAAQSAAIRGLYAAYQATGNAAFMAAADSAYSVLVNRFWSDADEAFRTSLGADEAVYTPRIVAILSGALREARLVGGHEEATELYVKFWNRVVNKMQLAEGPATGETGGDSDGDGIPFIPEQPDNLPPIAAERATLTLATTGVAGSSTGAPVPTRTGLAPNYPNPFNPSTVIRFTLRDAGHVVLAIYNTRGQEVRRLLDGRLSAGEHAVTFETGNLPAGIYLTRLTAEDGSQTRKMTLLK